MLGKKKKLPGIKISNDGIVFICGKHRNVEQKLKQESVDEKGSFFFIAKIV